MILILAAVVIFLVTVTVHEYCHGLVADRLGDSTARLSGRLTLNPLKHLDPFWTVILPLLLFISTQGRFILGMAKPVPVNFLNLRNPKRDMIWVALAGPLANLVMASLLSGLFKLFPLTVFLYAIYFNIGLGLFNLIPIPPLDGSKIVTGLLPMPLALLYLQLERYGYILILVLYFTGMLSKLIIPGFNFFCRFLDIPVIQV